MKDASLHSKSQLRTDFQSWCRLWNELGCDSPSKNLYHQLCNVYSDSARHYHTLMHLEECMTYLSDVRLLCRSPAEVGVALWFHDAVYDPRQTDNEEQSAQWAEQAAQEYKIGKLVSQRIRDLILTTKHQVQPTDNDAQILCDIDLAILGAPEERFAEYERQVREEYFWVSDVQFSAGRQHILETLLSRSSIYCTEHFGSLFEEKARTNLKHSLVRLSTA